VVQTAPGEVYTALERGVVDGYGWPITGVFDLGWQEKTKYRVDPGFYSAEVSILVNKSAWDKLSEAQRKVLRKAGEQAEADAIGIFAEENAKDTKRQAEAGIQTITLSGDVGKTFHDKATKPLGRCHPPEAAARPEAEGILRQDQLNQYYLSKDHARMARLSHWYGRLLEALLLVACPTAAGDDLADRRRRPAAQYRHGRIAPSNEISEGHPSTC